MERVASRGVMPTGFGNPGVASSDIMPSRDTLLGVMVPTVGSPEIGVRSNINFLFGPKDGIGIKESSEKGVYLSD